MIPIGFLIIVFGILLIMSQKYVKDSSIKKYLDQYLWTKIIFALFVLSIGVTSINNLIAQNLLVFPLGILSSLWMDLAFTFVLLHSSLALGNKNTGILFILSLFFGFFSEFLGVKYGLIFGHYYYNLPPFFFGAVPLMTPISWAIIIYMCYGVTNFILQSAGGDKPNLRDNRVNLFIMIIVLSSIDGLIAMNLDMIIDPIAALPGVEAWVWIGGGPYFAVPISNFIGWFMVTFVATFIFRFYESLSNKTEIQKDMSLFTYIPAVYFLYFLEHATFAMKNGSHIEIVLIGVAAMLPFILISILLFLNKHYKENNENK